MKGDFYSTWQLRRKRGKGKFVLITSLLWSICTMILYFLIMAVFEEHFATFNAMLLAFLGFLIMGIPVALIIWHRNEKKWLYWRSLAKRRKATPKASEGTSSPH